MKFTIAPLKRAGVTFVTAALVAWLPSQAVASTAERQPLVPLPLSHNGGTWDSGHVQGVAVDLDIYYSFTNLLAKYDLAGRLIGTLVGWTGHLGDLAFNPTDGKLYGSLEYKADQAFYIAVIDVAGLDGVGVEAGESGLFIWTRSPGTTPPIWTATGASTATWPRPATIATAPRASMGWRSARASGAGTAPLC